MHSLVVTLLLTLLWISPASGAPPEEASCPAGHKRSFEVGQAWSVCVPSDWSRRERGSEVVWSPEPRAPQKSIRGVLEQGMDRISRCGRG